jgi:hypothetical protein
MALVRRLAGLLVIVVLMLVMFGSGWLTARLRVGSAIDAASLPTLERRFTEQMRGAALVGRFTVAGREDRQASPDRYDISSVEKVGDDEWRFNARIRYGSVDATLPIVVTMRWVGDTPMITLTDFTIPRLGTFTARVFFYGDRYAGTWQHGAVGGHMFGRIEKQTRRDQP